MIAGLAMTPVTRPSALVDIPMAVVRWADAHGRILADEPLDPTEDLHPAVAGISVSLRDGCNTEIAHTATDDAGGFLFEGISAGEYTVVLTLPSSEDGRPALPPVQTWTGGSDGYRLTGSLR